MSRVIPSPRAASDTHENRVRNVRSERKNIGSCISRKILNVPMIFRVYKTAACWYELAGLSILAVPNDTEPQRPRCTNNLVVFFYLSQYNLKRKCQEVAAAEDKVGEAEGLAAVVI